MSSRLVQLRIQVLSDLAKKFSQEAQKVEGSNKKLADGMMRTSQVADRLAARMAKAAAAADALKKPFKFGDGGTGARFVAQMGLGLKAIIAMKVAAAGLQKTVAATKYTFKAAAMVGAAGIAGAATAKAVLSTPVDYDARAQDLANTSAKDSDAAGKIAEKANIKAAVESALAQAKGGTHDETLDLLGTMLAAGVERDDAFAQLPMLLKTQIASRMDGETLGNLTSVFKAAGIDQKDWGQMHSEGVRVGQDGTFEYASMAKNGLSEMVMSNKAMGMDGKEAFRQAIVDLQMLKKATGSDATAATDYKNFQAKITSSDTAGSLMKNFKIDLPAELQKGAVNGQSPIDSMMKVAEKIYQKEGKGDEYQKRMLEIAQLQKNGADKSVIDQKFNAVAALDHTGVMAQILPDMQAGFALRALQQFSGDGADFRTNMLNDNGKAVQTNWEANTSTAAASMQRGETAKETGQQNALDSGGGAVIKGVYDGFADVSAALPGVSAGLTALTGGLTIAAGAVGGGAMIGGGFQMMEWWRNRKKKGKNSGGLPDAPDMPGFGGGVQDVFVTNMGAGGLGGIDVPDGHGDKDKGKGGKGGASEPHEGGKAPKTSGGKWDGARKAAGLAGRIGGILGMASALYEGYDVLTDSSKTAGQKAQGVTAAAGGWAGAAGGAALGAAIGSIVPVLGTAIGGVLGGLAGGFGGLKYGHQAGDFVGGYARDAIDGSRPIQSFQGTGVQAALTSGLDMAAVSAALQTAAAQGTTQGLNGLPAIMAAQMPNLSQMPAYLTAPALAAIPPPVQKVEVSIKDGKLAVTVAVSPTSELLNAVARASTPTVALTGTVSGGSTNPASYGGSPIR